MSVNLKFHRPQMPVGERWLPLSGQDYFVKAWVPLAKGLRLQYVPYFHHGNIVIDHANVEQILDELRTLARVLDTMPGSELDYAVGGPCRRLIERLDMVKDAEDLCVYFI